MWIKIQACIVFVWSELKKGTNRTMIVKRPLWWQKDMFGARIKIMWEEQLVDPLIEYKGDFIWWIRWHVWMYKCISFSNPKHKLTRSSDVANFLNINYTIHFFLKLLEVRGRLDGFKDCILHWAECNGTSLYLGAFLSVKTNLIKAWSYLLGKKNFFYSTLFCWVEINPIQKVAILKFCITFRVL